MRIISGKYKIRTLPLPKSFDARPTTDFAKENLFNVLQNNYDLDEKLALDLFAGTGSISYELASHGCSQVFSIEKNPKHIHYIHSIIDKVRIQEITVIRADALKYIEKCKLSFDIIFADPPFQMAGIEKIPDLVFQHKLLNPEGFFILEHSKDYNFAFHPHFKTKKVYGSVNFSFFE